MQKRHWMLAVAVAITSVLPSLAAAQPHVGAIVWRLDADMEVDSAVDWDGSNDTADERRRDWDLKSSGVGFRAGYSFARIFTIQGDLGVAQATARSIDISDADLDMRSRGLDEGLYFSVGADASDLFPGAEHLFWGTNLSLRTFSSEFDEDIDTTWELDQTMLSFGGRIGYRVNDMGVYGGLRFVSDDTDLQITDTSRTPGLQTRSINLGRDGSTDLVVGAEFRGAPMAGFVEVGFVGSFGASTGVAMHF